MSYYELIYIVGRMTEVKSEQDLCTLNIFTDNLH